MTRLTKEIAKLDAILAEPGLFARDPAKAAASAKARSDHADALARAEEDWLEATPRSRPPWRKADARRRTPVYCVPFTKCRPASSAQVRLLSLGGGRRRTGALDRHQTAAIEPIHARPGSARHRKGHRALAALIGGDVGLVWYAGALHHIAFGHLERDATLHGRRRSRQHGFPGRRRHLPRSAGALAFRPDQIRLGDRSQGEFALAARKGRPVRLGGIAGVLQIRRRKGHVVETHVRSAARDRGRNQCDRRNALRDLTGSTICRALGHIRRHP